MADKLIAVPESLLDEIGMAIADKRDMTTPIPVPDMPMQIGLIESGGGFKKIYEENFQITEMNTTASGKVCFVSSGNEGLMEINKTSVLILRVTAKDVDLELASQYPRYVLSVYQFGLKVFPLNSISFTNQISYRVLNESKNVISGSGVFYFSINSKTGSVTIYYRTNDTTYVFPGTYTYEVYVVDFNGNDF